MLRRLAVVPLLLLALSLAACGGGSSGGGSESTPPSLASIERCLAAGKAEVSEGEEAAEALEESAGEAAGGERQVETFHDGRAVISFSSHPGEEDVELAQSCVE